MKDIVGPAIFVRILRALGIAPDTDWRIFHRQLRSSVVCIDGRSSKSFLVMRRKASGEWQYREPTQAW